MAKFRSENESFVGVGAPFTTYMRYHQNYWGTLLFTGLNSVTIDLYFFSSAANIGEVLVGVKTVGLIQGLKM